MRVLHTLSPNASQRPRLMVTQRFFVEEFYAMEGAAEEAAS